MATQGMFRFAMDAAMLRKQHLFGINVDGIFAELGASFLFSFFGSTAGAGAAGNGILLAVLVFVTAPVSGGHLNPAVSVALTAIGKCSIKVCITYSIAQIIGATMGNLLLRWLTETSLGCFAPAEGVHLAQAFGWETMMTGLLVTTVLGVACHDRATHFSTVAPIAIGGSLYAAALCGGPYTGGSLNPARTLGPSIANGCWNHFYAYLAGEFLGALVAAIIFYLAFLRGGNTTAAPDPALLDREREMTEENP